jgi:hypothetical protein
VAISRLRVIWNPHRVGAADNVLFVSKELTLHYPDIVNAKKNNELLYANKA